MFFTTAALQKFRDSPLDLVRLTRQSDRGGVKRPITAARQTAEK